MPTHDASLAQLLDMGIPRGRALAALKRSKDDAMAAAERVFAGEFDDIASDDEGDDEEAANGLPTPSDSVIDDTIEPTGPLRRGVQDVLISDDAPSDDDEGEMEFDDFLDDDATQPMMQDPYACVFFSKDRVERLVEPVPENLTADVPVPPGHAHLASNSSKTINVKVLGRGEWMSGCPEGSEQSFLFQIYNSLAEGSMPCAGGCGHRFKRAPEHFFSLLVGYSDIQELTVAYLPSVRGTPCEYHREQCPTCGHVTCFACGETTTATTSGGKGKKKADGSEIIDALFHCPTIQAVILGVGLQMMEQAFHPVDSQETEANPSPSSTKKRKLASTPSTEAEGLAAFGRKMLGKAPAKGTGYSGGANEDKRSGELAAEANQSKKDAATAALLSQVALYLPNVKREKTFTSDFMVHPTALAHLRRRSGFVNDLLRNDSLLDMTSRDTIYRALLDWLEIVANHEALAAMLAMPQMRPMTTEPGPDENTVTVTYEGRPSPRELLETIVIQATSALKGLSATAVPETPPAPTPADGAVDNNPFLANAAVKETADSEHAKNVALKVFCERILSARDNIDNHLANSRGQDFVDRMHSELPSISRSDAIGRPKLQPAETEEATIKIYEAWARSVSFQHCDLHDPADPAKTRYRHAFSGPLLSLVGMDAPKRSLAIAKELGVLSTNIPTAWDSSIFLRVDDDRVDCIKAMIIGPKDTPYENGCFLFDIFLPLEYNYRCPSVQFMTTNGGKYRYNPNLYADGKVCLSLLGTWQGPGWISGKSTLLQVLISIQSLILCEEPYLNEPGWASQGGTPASKAYSANIRRMVLHDAMANNIKNPPYPFEHEIKTHFTLKANAIRAQIDRWKALDNDKATNGDFFPTSEAETKTKASSSKSAFDKYADEMRRLLDELSPPATAAEPSSSKPVAVRRNPARGKK